MGRHRLLPGLGTPVATVERRPFPYSVNSFGLPRGHGLLPGRAARPLQRHLRQHFVSPLPLLIHRRLVLILLWRARTIRQQ
jgi:hypothetical protein